MNGYWGVDTHPTKSWVTQLPDEEYAVSVAVEASGQGRKPVSRSGTCTSIEMKRKHNGKDFDGLFSACHGMAETRAVGRASGAFFMVADVPAEEVEGHPDFNPQQSEQKEFAKKVPQGHCSHPDDAVELIDPTSPGDPHRCAKCKKPVDTATVSRLNRAKAEAKEKQ